MIDVKNIQQGHLCVCFHAMAKRPPLCAIASCPNRQLFSMMEYDSRARSHALCRHSSGGMPSMPAALPTETLRKAVFLNKLISAVHGSVHEESQCSKTWLNWSAMFVWILHVSASVRPPYVEKILSISVGQLGECRKLCGQRLSQMEDMHA